MKKQNNLFVSFLLLSFIISINTFGGDDNRKLDIDSVTTIEQFPNHYKSGDYYFGGQPSYEALQWLKKEGVKVVINLRSEKEMQQYAKQAYNEENIVKSMNMSYFLLPVDGDKDYNVEKLRQFSDLLNENPGKVYIHCGSCWRVTYYFMAYLIEYENYDINEAITFGKKLKYTNQLEGLLGKDIEYNTLYPPSE